MNNRVPIMCISCASYIIVVFPYPTAKPQPATIQDIEPEATCKLAVLSSTVKQYATLYLHALWQ